MGFTVKFFIKGPRKFHKKRFSENMALMYTVKYVSAYKRRSSILMAGQFQIIFKILVAANMFAWRISYQVTS